MIYLSYAELLYIEMRAIGADRPVRDLGLLESALARPRASAFGENAYPCLAKKGRDPDAFPG